MGFSSKSTVVTKQSEGGHLFSNKDLLLLLIPIIAEQFLTSLMGLADSMMVSNVDDYSLGAVQLVDSINILVNQAFAALATGGVVICSNFIGQNNTQKAKEAASQVSLVALIMSVSMMVICLILRLTILHAVFGKVEPALMREAEVYFFITILSFPGIAMYNSGAAIYRAQGNTSLPLVISIICNGLNILGNAVFIYVLSLGVAGAALSTMVSRWLSAGIVYAFLHRKNQRIVVRDYLKIRPDKALIKRILGLGIPNGIENSMFQFGKLAISSTVSTMATAAITAQAMSNIMENVNGVAGCGVGIGLMTVVGQSLGAGRKDEAKYYVKKLAVWAEIAILSSCLLVYFLREPITRIGGMNEESARLCMYMIGWITIVKPIAWVPSFLPGYGMRAAGDVRFSMIVSTISMWVVRVGLCMLLVYGFGYVSPMAVWIGMFADWTIRGICFFFRLKSGKWLRISDADIK